MTRFIPLLVFLLIAMGYNGQMQFGDWDTNGSNYISRAEFDEQFPEVVVSRWDINGSGVIEEDEFNQIYFEYWDENNNGEISPEEFAIYAEALGYDTGFEERDEDGSGFLSYDEYRLYLMDEGVYDEWDGNSNNEIDAQEAADKIFSIWDENGDGKISPREYSDAKLK